MSSMIPVTLDGIGALEVNVPAERLAAIALRLTGIEQKVSKINEVSQCVLSLQRDVAVLKVKMQGLGGLSSQKASDNIGRKFVVSFDKLLDQPSLPEDSLSRQDASDSKRRKSVVSFDELLEGAGFPEDWQSMQGASDRSGEKCVVSLDNFVEELEEAPLSCLSNFNQVLSPQVLAMDAIVDNQDRSQQDNSFVPEAPDNQMVHCPAHNVDAICSYLDLYRVRQSTYDVTLYMFTPLQRWTSSIGDLVNSMLNFVIQFGFMFVVYYSFNESDFSKEHAQAFRIWRTHIAHDLGAMERNTQLSLASRVCDISAHPTLEVSTEQAQYVEDIYKYLEYEAGFVLCSLCITFWLLVVTSEARETLCFLRAVNMLHTSACTTVDLANGGIQFVSFSKTRRISLAICSCLRLVCAACLGYVGIFFLVYTRQLGDLILNAAALEFIFQVDELICASLTQAKTKTMIDRTKPLVFRLAGWRAAISKQIFVMGAISIIIPSLVLPERPARFDVLRELCPFKEEHALLRHYKEDRGVDNFVSTYNTMGLFQWAETKPAMRPSINQQVYISQIYDFYFDRLNATEADRLARRQTLSIDGRTNSMFFERDTPQEIRNAYRHRRWAASVDYSVWPLRREGNAGCHDMFRSDNSTTRFTSLNHYRRAVGEAAFRKISEELNTRLTDCAEVTPWCLSGTTAGLLIRQWCPATCNCTRMHSHLYAHVIWGCSATCPYHPQYELDRQTTLCEDTHKGSPTWKSWLAMLDSMPSSWPYDTLRKYGAERGCRVILMFLRRRRDRAPEDLCAADEIVDGVLIGKLLRSWCPVTCKCAVKVDALDCPYSCNGTYTHSAVSFYGKAPVARGPARKVGIPDMNQMREELNARRQQ